MVKGPPFREKKITIKEEYQDKVNMLRQTLYNSISSFEKDSGCQVTHIDCDYSYDLLTFKIITDILLEPK